MEFAHVQKFFESWGLTFDTPSGESSTIPYPATFERVIRDASRYSKEFRSFVNSVTDTTDGETYLDAESWDDIRAEWDKLPKEAKPARKMKKFTLYYRVFDEFSGNFTGLFVQLRVEANSLKSAISQSQDKQDGIFQSSMRLCGKNVNDMNPYAYKVRR